MANKTPISLLQELMVAKLQPMPIYSEKGFGTQFSCVARAGGVSAEGFASSKKMAKQESARKVLEILQGKPLKPVTIPTQPTRLAAITNPFKNHIGELNEYATKYSVSYPEYSLDTYDVDGRFVINCHLQTHRTQGVGTTKKNAKQDAAKNMLQILATSKPVFRPIKNSYSVDEKDDIIRMYNQLSIQKNDFVETKIKELIAAPGINEESDDIDVLKRDLRENSVDFTIKNIQHDPYIMAFVVKDTNFILLGHGESKEAATRAVLKTAVRYKKRGSSFSTANMLS